MSVDQQAGWASVLPSQERNASRASKRFSGMFLRFWSPPCHFSSISSLTSRVTWWQGCKELTTIPVFRAYPLYCIHSLTHTGGTYHAQALLGTQEDLALAKPDHFSKVIRWWREQKHLSAKGTGEERHSSTQAPVCRWPCSRTPPAFAIILDSERTLQQEAAEWGGDGSFPF